MPDSPRKPSENPTMSRRIWLAGMAAAAAGCSSDRPKGGLLGLGERWNNRVQGLLFRKQKLAREQPEGSETDEDDFPSYHIADKAPVAPGGWVLKVGGAVARPGTFTLDDLERMSRTDMRVRHYCVEGWSAIAAWHGVRIRDLAERVGADPRAPYVEFRSFDRSGDQAYWSSWDRASAFHPQTLLAYGKNGEDLDRFQGAPLRLYGAVKLGYKQVKYLSEVNFLPEMTGGYWEAKGYEWFAGV